MRALPTFAKKAAYRRVFDSAGEDDWIPRYNVAPTQPVPIIRQNPKEPRRELSLVPLGTHSVVGERFVGRGQHDYARSETAATKPAFRDALKLRRCLIPADGFYQWRRRVYVQKKMFAEAIEEFQSADTLSEGHPFLRAWLGYGYAVSGRSRDALGILNQLTHPSNGKYVSPYDVAAIWARLGRTDEAVKWLQRPMRSVPPIFMTSMQNLSSIPFAPISGSKP